MIKQLAVWGNGPSGWWMYFGGGKSDIVWLHFTNFFFWHLHAYQLNWFASHCANTVKPCARPFGTVHICIDVYFISLCGTFVALFVCWLLLLFFLSMFLHQFKFKTKEKQTKSERTVKKETKKMKRNKLATAELICNRSLLFFFLCLCLKSNACRHRDRHTCLSYASVLALRCVCDLLMCFRAKISPRKNAYVWTLSIKSFVTVKRTFRTFFSRAPINYTQNVCECAFQSSSFCFHFFVHFWSIQLSRNYCKTSRIKRALGNWTSQTLSLSSSQTIIIDEWWICYKWTHAHTASAFFCIHTNVSAEDCWEIPSPSHFVAAKQSKWKSETIVRRKSTNYNEPRLMPLVGCILSIFGTEIARSNLHHFTHRDVY